MKVSTYWTIVIMMYREYAARYPLSSFVKECLEDFEEAYAVKKDCTEEYDDEELASKELIRHSRLGYILKYNPELSYKDLGRAKRGILFPKLMSTLYGLPTLARAIKAAED